MLYLLSGSCPHSSPDPFGATLPPGEGMDFLTSSTNGDCRILQQSPLLFYPSESR